MRILVPSVSGATRPDGVSRHAINLARCLLHIPGIEHVDLVAGEWQIPYIESMLGNVDARLHLIIAGTKRSSFARNVWYYDRLPLLAKQARSDLIHATYPVPLNRRKLLCPIVTTLHDLYPYDATHNFGYPKVLLNRLILHQCLTASDAIICVSDSTLERLAAHYPGLLNKASRIYNCVEPTTQAGFNPVSALAGRPFVLAVAQHRRNKNIPLTLSVFKRLLRFEPELVLLLVGRYGPETDAVCSLLKGPALSSRVIMLNGISEQQLHWCYRNSKLLLATSSVEGFGLPVAEAMLAGCPVVCSDIPAFREIGEGYARLIPLDAQQVESFVRAVRGTLHAARPAPMPLSHLSVADIAQRYLHLYCGLLTTPYLASAGSFELGNQKGGAG
jgi:glycosyltransferase involved in cell wall biosynthesis